MSETTSLEEALTEAFGKADALDAPLDARLRFYLGESRKLLPDLETTYDQLVARIRNNGADMFVPAVGEKLPDFLMTDSEGRLVDLASLTAPGPWYSASIVGHGATIAGSSFTRSPGPIPRLSPPAAMSCRSYPRLEDMRGCSRRAAACRSEC